jgi:hypothetical protein
MPSDAVTQQLRQFYITLNGIHMIIEVLLRTAQNKKRAMSDMTLFYYIFISISLLALQIHYIYLNHH